jgi:hypothetical protein
MPEHFKVPPAEVIGHPVSAIFRIIAPVRALVRLMDHAYKSKNSVKISINFQAKKNRKLTMISFKA